MGAAGELLPTCACRPLHAQLTLRLRMSCDAANELCGIALTMAHSTGKKIAILALRQLVGGPAAGGRVGRPPRSVCHDARALHAVGAGAGRAGGPLPVNLVRRPPARARVAAARRAAAAQDGAGGGLCRGAAGGALRQGRGRGGGGSDGGGHPRQQVRARVHTRQALRVRAGAQQPNQEPKVVLPSAPSIHRVPRQPTPPRTSAARARSPAAQKGTGDPAARFLSSYRRTFDSDRQAALATRPRSDFDQGRGFPLNSKLRADTFQLASLCAPGERQPGRAGGRGEFTRWPGESGSRYGVSVFADEYAAGR